MTEIQSADCSERMTQSDCSQDIAVERRLCLGRPYGRLGGGAGRESEANSGGGFRRVLKMSPYRRAIMKGVDDAKRSSFGL